MLARPDKADATRDSLRSGPVSTDDMRGRRRRAEPVAWDPGPAPRGWKLFLMRLAGVDTSIAAMVPRDEQQQIWRVGAAVLLGAAMQAICFSVSMQLAFGVDGPTRLACVGVTFAICGVLYLMDAKFVAADWKAQGMAFARSQGLIEAATAWERCRRPAAALLRWTCSVFISWTLATFVLMQVFKADIERQWLSNYQRGNAGLIEEVAQHHAGLVHLAEAKLAETRRLNDALTKERTALAAAMPDTADVDAQIAQAVERVAKLRKTRDQAQVRLGERETDAAAERLGVTEKSRHSGQAGLGARYQFHMEQARLLRESIATMSGEINDLETEVARLRQLREKKLSDARQATEKALTALDAQIAETGERFQSELTERDALVKGRSEWIEHETRRSSRYVPMPQGLIDRLTALWTLAAASTGIFWLIVGTKALIMLLESAGPLAKVFFTPPGVYGLYVAMRVHEVAAAEVAWRRPRADEDADDRDHGAAGVRAPPPRAARRWSLSEKMGAEKPQAAE
jgi:uncharacterized protein DUF4407